MPVVIIINNNETNLPKIEMSKCLTVSFREKSFGEDPSTIFFVYFESIVQRVFFNHNKFK